MKALILHHLGTPCLCQIRRSSDEITESNTEYFLNPDVLVRIEPGGAVLTPPQLYSTFLHIDQQLLEEIMKEKINVYEWPKETFDLMLSNQVILSQKVEKTVERLLRVGIPGLPNQVLFEVTSNCQCNCDQCYHRQDLNGYNPEINQLYKRIDKLKELGVGIFEVTGGEPLLRNDLAEILSYIYNQGLHYYVVTNGEYLKNASSVLLKYLRKGLGVAVSLDGVDEIHDQIRHRLGLYGKILEGLDIVAKNGINIYFISTLNNRNFSTIPGMIELANKYKTTVHLRPTINTGAAKDNGLSVDLRPMIGDYLSNPSVRNGLLSTKKIIPEAKYYGCGIRKRISVDAHGNIFPCVMDRDNKLSQLLNYDEKTLSYELEKETRRFLSGNNKCYNCEYILLKNELRCGGGCRFSQFYNSKE